MSGKTARERLMAELKYIKVSKTYLCVYVLTLFILFQSCTYLYTCILFDTPLRHQLSVISNHTIRWEGCRGNNNFANVGSSS
jgi:hypothetical protein